MYCSQCGESGTRINFLPVHACPWLLVPECFLIEPTETKEAMDDFIDAMAKILEEANTNPETVTEAAFTQPVRRLDEVKAAKELDLVWSE